MFNPVYLFSSPFSFFLIFVSLFFIYFSLLFLFLILPYLFLPFHRLFSFSLLSPHSCCYSFSFSSLALLTYFHFFLHSLSPPLFSSFSLSPSVFFLFSFPFSLFPLSLSLSFRSLFLFLTGAFIFPSFPLPPLSLFSFRSLPFYYRASYLSLSLISPALVFLLLFSSSLSLFLRLSSSSLPFSFSLSPAACYRAILEFHVDRQNKELSFLESCSWRLGGDSTGFVSWRVTGILLHFETPGCCCCLDGRGVRVGVRRACLCPCVCLSVQERVELCPNVCQCVFVIIFLGLSELFWFRRWWTDWPAPVFHLSGNKSSLLPPCSGDVVDAEWHA